MPPSSSTEGVKGSFVSGMPRPNVTWYLDNTVIDESFENRPDGITVNHLSYPNIGRQHVNARFVCMASNTNLTPPNNKVVILDVNRKYLLLQFKVNDRFVLYRECWVDSNVKSLHNTFSTIEQKNKITGQNRNKDIYIINVSYAVSIVYCFCGSIQLLYCVSVYILSIYTFGKQTRKIN